MKLKILKNETGLIRLTDLTNQEEFD